MKTLRVQFKENGKEYNFNDTNAFTKVGDYVAVVTVNGFSVVRVTAIEDEFDPKHTPIIGVIDTSGLPDDYYSFLTYQKGSEDYLIRKESKEYDKLYFLNLLFKYDATFSKTFVTKCKDYQSDSDNDVRVIKVTQEMSKLKVEVLQEFSSEYYFEKEYLSNLGLTIKTTPYMRGEYYINVLKGKDLGNEYSYQLDDGEEIKDYLASLAPEGARLYITREWEGTEIVLDDENGNLEPWVQAIIKDADVFKQFYLDDLTYYSFLFLANRPYIQHKNDPFYIVREELFAAGKYDCFVFVEIIDWESEEDFGTDYFYSFYTNALA